MTTERIEVENKKISISIFNILLPIFLLNVLMIIALINFPVIIENSKENVIVVFAAIIIYIFLWILLKPDKYSKNGGLLIGLLFIINISVEDFINWQTKTFNLISTLSMMFLIFISFSIISVMRTLHTHNIIKGIKSSFVSALLGTTIALCFGFSIIYLFPQRMAFILKNDPGFKDYNSPISFAFLNAFDNASNHVIAAPIISIIMGALGGVIALLILRRRNS